MKVNMHEAKSQLSRLGKLAWEGEEIVIAKAGEPYLRLEPYRERLGKRLGGMEGRIWIAPDFDETPYLRLEPYRERLGKRNSAVWKGKSGLLRILTRHPRK